MIGEGIIFILGSRTYFKSMINVYIRKKEDTFSMQILYSQLMFKKLTLTDIDGSISLDKRLSETIGSI
jgi:hypothetical protein